MKNIYKITAIVIWMTIIGCGGSNSSGGSDDGGGNDQKAQPATNSIILHENMVEDNPNYSKNRGR